MSVSFYSRKGNEFVRIEDEHKLFDEPIIYESPNGKYCVAAGYWYINDEDSENDGDKIEGSYETIVFSSGEVLHRTQCGEDAEDYVLWDDGKLCILEENSVSIWSASEKPVRKKFTFSCSESGFTNDYAWAYGNGEDGKLQFSMFLFKTGEFINKKFAFSEFDCWFTDEFFSAYGDGDDGHLRLSVFIFETGKMWTKRLSENISEIKAVLMVKDSQSSIYAVAENYDDEDLVIQYDMDGKKQELTRENLQKVLMAIAQNGTEPTTSEQEQDVEPPPMPAETKKKFPVWVIVLIIVIILALIGKYVAN